MGSFASGGASHRTLAEKAFGMLHDAIVSGALLPGERLPIEDLAAATGMSPMPIREALRRLDGVGLVENVPHRGARVADLSVEDLREVYDSRLMLEVPAIARAAAKFDEEDAANAAEWLERLETAIQREDDADALEAHTGFHFALYRAASSRWLVRLISPLWDSAERYRVATVGVRRLFQSRVDEHQKLLDPCVERQVEVAEARLWNHLVRTANLVAAEMGGEELYELKDVPKASRSGSKRSQ
ncbi:MAG: GntR family transcriptional regulator [Actinobacteria bacterium]|nr:GntR family transcriptional regulator [Actinomycetota bacterium]